MMPNQTFTAYRRDLPHWRLDGATYFLTWCLHRRQSDLEPSERTIVLEVMRFAHRSDFRLSAAVVMNDHVHAVVTPNRGHQLTANQHSWKSFSAFRLQRESGRRGKIWQDEAYDRIVRDDPALNRFVDDF